MLPEYDIWQSAKARCSNPNANAYSGYGERGIKMCAGWFNSPQVFLSDVGPRPSAQHSIDRIDNDGNYSCGKCEECLANGWPMNVRWATRREQAENKRNNIWLTLDGESHVLSEWARIKNLPPKVLRYRKKAGWDDEKILTTSNVEPRRRGSDGLFLSK